MSKSTDIAIISCRLSGQKTAIPPLGPMYLVSSLRQSGWSASLFDFQLSEGAHIFDVPGLVELICDCDSDIVGFSLFGDALPLVLASIRSYSSSFCPKSFVLGGPGINGNELEILANFPEVCCIVRGEGEESLPDVLCGIKSRNLIQRQGVYWQGHASSRGPVPPRIDNLDAIAKPAYDCLDLKRYGRLPVVTSRGCPFDCSFCEIIAMWGRKTVYRSVSNVVEELKTLTAATGCIQFDFIDDTFTLSKKRVLGLCDALCNSNLGIKWTCFSRIDTIDQEMMEAMEHAGCSNVFFGIDTGSELIWRGIHKDFSREQVTDVVSKSLQHFDVTASYIWGYPDEALPEFADTINRSYDIARLSGQFRVTTQLHFLSPTRATPIFEKSRSALRFDEAIPLEIIGAPMRSFRANPGYDICTELIRSNPAMFAPFYFYDSPDLKEKLAVMQMADEINRAGAARILLSKNREEAVQAEVEACALSAEGGQYLVELANKVAYPRVNWRNHFRLSSLLSPEPTRKRRAPSRRLVGNGP